MDELFKKPPKLSESLCKLGQTVSMRQVGPSQWVFDNSEPRPACQCDRLDEVQRSNQAALEDNRRLRRIVEIYELCTNRDIQSVVEERMREEGLQGVSAVGDAKAAFVGVDLTQTHSRIAAASALINAGDGHTFTLAPNKDSAQCPYCYLHGGLCAEHKELSR